MDFKFPVSVCSNAFSFSMPIDMHGDRNTLKLVLTTVGCNNAVVDKMPNSQRAES